MIKNLLILLAILVALLVAHISCLVHVTRHSEVAHESAKRYLEENESKIISDMANYLATQHFTLNKIGAPKMREMIKDALAEGELSPQPGPDDRPPYNSIKIARAPWWRIGPGWNVEAETSIILNVADPNLDNPAPRFMSRLRHNILVDTDTGEIISVKPHETKRFVWVTYSQEDAPPWYVAITHNP